MEIFYLDNGRYPLASQSPREDLESVLRGAGVYTETRASKDDWNAGVYPSKRFVLCSPTADDESFVVAAAAPIIKDRSLY